MIQSLHHSVTGKCTDVIWKVCFYNICLRCIFECYIGWCLRGFGFCPLPPFHVVEFRLQQYIFFVFCFLVSAHIDCWATTVCICFFLVLGHWNSWNQATKNQVNVSPHIFYTQSLYCTLIPLCVFMSSVLSSPVTLQVTVQLQGSSKSI